MQENFRKWYKSYKSIQWKLTKLQIETEERNFMAGIYDKQIIVFNNSGKSEMPTEILEN